MRVGCAITWEPRAIWCPTPFVLHPLVLYSTPSSPPNDRRPSADYNHPRRRHKYCINDMAMDTIRDLARVFDPLRLATRVLLTTSRALSSVPGTPHAYPGMRIKQIQADDLPFLQLVVDELGGDPNDPGSFHHRLRGIVRLANL